MEVNPNHRTGGLQPTSAPRTTPRRTETASEAVSFEGKAAIDRALRDVPDKRVEMIERAQRLVGDPTYPPRETLRSLAHLLAMNLS